MRKSRLLLMRKTVSAAFPFTIPIGFAYLFLGLSYGLLMANKGFPTWVTALMATVIFAGSLEFVMADLLLGTFNPLLAFLMALMVNARHIFYGLAMLKKYQGSGKKKWYLIFGLTDETFAINSSVDVPHDVDRSWFYFFVTLLSQSYWVFSSILGSVVGAFLPVKIAGIDFVLTAMFAAIFLEEWLKTRRHSSAAIGVLCALACRLIFGANQFLIPTMLTMLVVFSIMYTVTRREN